MIRRTTVFLAAVLAIVAVPPLHAQLTLPDQGQTLPTFEVATIKPSRSDLGRSFHVSIWWNDNSYRTENLTLREFIRNAFNATSDAQLTGGPDALLDSRFDISAKIGDDAFAAMKKLPNAQRQRTVQLMMQALLADRFGLKVHTETRDLPVFNLIVDKGGSKLQLYDAGAPTAAADPTPHPASAAATQPSSGAPAKPHLGSYVSIGRDQASITATGQRVESLLTTLARQPELDGRLVIDKTGLTGKYNFTLNWSPERLGAAASTDATGPSLFAALKEQLGLKLEPAKAPVPIIVIDAASAPSPN